MENLSDDAVKAKFNDALAAISRARDPVKARPLVVQLRTALTLAIESFETSPAPSPFPTDDLGNRGGG